MEQVSEIPTPHGDLIDRDVYITMLEQMAEDSKDREAEAEIAKP